MHATLHADPSSAGCRAFVAALDAVVDGSANARLVMRTEAHAAECTPCAHRLAAARAYRERLRRAAEAERATSTLRERVERILPAVRRSPTR